MGQARGDFLRLLGKLGEILWTGEDYAGLLEMQDCYDLAWKLRHMKTVTPLTMGLAAMLPDVFVRPKILAAVTTPGCAEDVIEAVQTVQIGASEDQLRRLAGRMAKGHTVGKVLDMLGTALLPETFMTLIPVPTLGDQFQPVGTRKQLKAVALAFKNCLRDYDEELASGENAVFVWSGGEAKVVLSIKRDPLGWLLEEAKLADNKPLPAALLLKLAAELAVGGVRVGTGPAILQQRLHEHGCATCAAPNYPPYPDWRGELQKAIKAVAAAKAT